MLTLGRRQVRTGYANKDFVGETLGGLAVDQRPVGTLATNAVWAWQGVAVFRAHYVVQTREVPETVAGFTGKRPPAVRGRV